MSNERLVKVESEAELRPGMVVVVRPCYLGGCGPHRMMLIRRNARPGRVKHTFEVSLAAWDVVPNPHGVHQWSLHLTIAEGRLYRVVDGLDVAKEAKRDRELEKTP